MKLLMLNCLIATGLSLFISSSLIAAPETFKIDPSHSFVTWQVNHFGFSNPSGKSSFEGEITLDEANPTESKVKVVIDTAHPITGVTKLDEHLKNKDFFDTKKYPKTTFVSDKVDVTGSNQAKVHGILTLHGVSKPVILDVAINQIGEGNYTHKKTVGFSATTTIKRSDFGMMTYLPNLSDVVKIQIESEAILG